jgi:hypothetical protein
MVIGIFVGGIFLGFSLGVATMALLAARGPRYDDQEAQPIVGDLCAYSPVGNLSPSLEAGPQASGAWFTPEP